MTQTKRKAVGMLRLFMALVVLLLAFGHVPPVADGSQQRLLVEAAFALPDGSIPDLCVPSGSSQSDHAKRQDDCLACRIGSQFLLPDLSASVAIPFRLETDQPSGLEAGPLYVPVERVSTQPRAPPALLLIA